MLAYLDIIRPKNLLIVAITQLIFQYFVIDPTFRSSGIFWTLSPIQFSLLMLSTVLIAAGGYVINDYYDVDIDRINKTDDRIVGVRLSESSTWSYYKFIVMAGALVSYFVANQINQPVLFLIYPLAVLLLFLYSWKLKHVALLGNMLISSFIGVVIFILIFAEREGIQTLIDRNQGLYYIFLSFSIFIVAQAFISNLIREIVKDIEDIEGDQESQSITLPILLSINGAKSVIVFLGSIMLIGFYFWWRLMGEWMDNIHLAYFLIGIVFPLLLITLMTIAAKSKSQFHLISSILKAYMIIGILYLMFYPI